MPSTIIAGCPLSIDCALAGSTSQAETRHHSAPGRVPARPRSAGRRRKERSGERTARVPFGMSSSPDSSQYGFKYMHSNQSKTHRQSTITDAVAVASCFSILRVALTPRTDHLANFRQRNRGSAHHYLSSLNLDLYSSKRRK